MTNIKNIYLEFKNILSGCRTIFDAYYFAQYIIKNNPEHKDLINGMIHGKQYESVLDLRRVADILKQLDKLKTREEVDNYIDANVSANIDKIQLNSFLTIGKRKKNITTMSPENIPTASVESENQKIIDLNISSKYEHILQEVENLMKDDIQLDHIIDEKIEDEF